MPATKRPAIQKRPATWHRRVTLAAACGVLLQFATCTAIVQESLIDGFLAATTNVLVGPVADAARDAADPLTP